MSRPTEVEQVETSLGEDSPAPERVLVVGATPNVPGAVALSWEEFAQRQENIADYSLVVVALDTFDLTGTPRTRAREAFIERGFRFLQGPDTELVLIGSSSIGEQILSHLGRGFAYQKESGSFVTFRSDELEGYLRHVDRYDFILQPVADAGVEHSAVMLAAQRDILGAAVTASGQSRTLILPSPSSVELDDGVASLLTEVYGLEGGVSQAPDWMEEITLPADSDLRNERAEVEGALAPLLARQSEIADEMAEARRLLGVLYESGTTLEDLVRELLGELGAEVTPPPDNETDDGTIITPSGGQVVLEIKGRSGPITVADARQLTDWVDVRTYPDDESDPEDWKGLLIGNPFRHVPLNQRPGVLFTPPCERVAVGRGHALVTTSQLVDALRQAQMGTFDEEQ